METRKRPEVRRLRYSVAVSLDGFIARPDGSFDWIPHDDAIDFAAFLDGIDTVLMGRTSFEVVMSQEEDSWLSGFAVHVVSRTLKPEDHPGVTIVSTDAEAAVAQLKAMNGKDIWLFGGGTLAASLLAAGLVDTVEVGIVPVVLGEGIPLVGTLDASPTLSLHSIETFPSGIVLAKYRVGGPESG